MSGRKRKVGAKRTPSGRLSRASGAYQENIEPILTRMRIFGLSEVDARDQKAATFLGRLQLQKIISHAQYDAGVEYLRIYEAYQRAVKSPNSMRTGSGGDGGEEPNDYADRCRRAVAKHDQSVDAIRAEQNLHEHRGANFYAAVDYIVTRDAEMWHMVGDLRLALNSLAHHFGLMGKGKRQPIDSRPEIAA